MLDRFSIRTRLLVSTGLLIVLLVSLLLVYQSALSRVEASFLKMGADLRQFRDKPLEIGTLVNEVLGSVSDFVLHKDIAQADHARQGLHQIQMLVVDIRQHAEAARHPEIMPLATSQLKATAELQGVLESMIDAQVRRGLGKDAGLIGRLRSLSHRLLEDEITSHAVDALLGDLLEIEHLLLDEGRRRQGDKMALESALSDFDREFRARIEERRHPELQQRYALFQEATRLSGQGRATAERAAEQAGALSRELRGIGVRNIEALVLQIRRYEKDYQLREDADSVANLHQAVQAVQMAYSQSRLSDEAKAGAEHLLDEYVMDFDQLVACDDELAKLDSRLHAAARHVQEAQTAMLAVSQRQADSSENHAKAVARTAGRIASGLCLLAIFGGLGISLLINRSIDQPLRVLLDALTRLSQGDYLVRVRQLARDEIGRLGTIFNQMAETIGSSQWLAAGRNQMAEELREDKAEERLCRDVISFLGRYLAAAAGVIYVGRRDGRLSLGASYSAQPLSQLPIEFAPGDGLVGEAALGRQLMVRDDLPSAYLHLESGLGGATPTSLMLMPLVWRGMVQGVIELAAFAPFSATQRSFLEEVAEGIAIAIHSCRQRQETVALLEETRRQAAVLQTQQEELRASNEELESQTLALRQSEEELRTQQEELQVANEELEEKSDSLVRQKRDTEAKNRDLEEARRDIEAQAKELAAASRYKSEFLANMSHELRTPLNSMLLLARNLSQNKAGNLQPVQIESAAIIYNSGQDLLRLINDILDLSKIEAGRMDVLSEEIGLRGLGDWLRSNFAHLAEDKGLALTVEYGADMPSAIRSDRQRLEQILRNLVGNAIKFTDSGGVTVSFTRPPAGARLTDVELDPEKTLAIVVRDTGIGISPAQQRAVFEAFHQAEGGTSRRYGGTGLGLSISKKLTELLGGEVQLTSEPGLGSTFTVYLPLQREAAAQTGGAPVARLQLAPRPLVPELVGGEPPPPSLPDDRDALGPDDKRLLIIEDDIAFAKVVMSQGREKGFKCLVAVDGNEGLLLAKKYAPSAIILDIVLPSLDGWQVLEVLKSDPGLRHIPVHMMSGQERTLEAFQKGAVGFLSKPVSEEGLRQAFACLDDALSARMRDLLVVEDDPIVRQSIVELIGNGDVESTAVGSGAEAIAALNAKKYDCMILDIGLPDMSGFELLDQVRREGTVEIPPVIIYTGRELTREESLTLARYTSTVIIKGVKSEERLLDETALFLHRVVSKLPAEKRQMIASLYDQDTMFRGKKILVVDDDMRNAFALSRILEERGLQIIIANDGQQALMILARDPGLDLVLMDIMMPGMDGYEAISKIRAQERFWNLPIIALTAKAMPEDKEKCMAMGASDYLAKPVNEDRLLSLMRVWLYR